MISKSSYSNTETFLFRANLLADRMLGTRENPIIQHHHEHYGYHGCGGCYGNSSSGESEGNSNKFIGVVSVIVALGVSYTIVQKWTEFSQVKAEISDTNALESDISKELTGDLKEAVDQVFIKQMALLTHLKTDARNELCIRSVFATSLMLLGAACLTAVAAPLTTTALVFGAISGSALLWRHGVQSVDVKLSGEAKELRFVIDKASVVFHDMLNLSRLSA